MTATGTIQQQGDAFGRKRYRSRPGGYEGRKEKDVRKIDLLGYEIDEIDWEKYRTKRNTMDVDKLIEKNARVTYDVSSYTVSEQFDGITELLKTIKNALVYQGRSELEKRGFTGKNGRFESSRLEWRPLRGSECFELTVWHYGKENTKTQANVDLYMSGEMFVRVR